MNEILREFLLETHENLAQLDVDLVSLEKSPDESETIARVFRTLHTVKGTAGFLGLGKLQHVTHAGENLLSRLRARELSFNAEIATALLGVVDAIRQMLAAVEETEKEGDGDYTALVQTLERLTQSSAEVPPPQAVPKSALSAPASPPPSSIVTAPVSTVSEDVAEFKAAVVADSSIRVDVGLLDKLMNLVGELVLTRNQVLQLSGTQGNDRFLDTAHRLNRLTTELQAGVMKTRMQAIGQVWSKFPRLVRDLAVACDKQVRIEMDGQETELDKSILESIRDPLTHMVRNAVDHGIESPAERLSRGKPAEGHLLLRASHQGGKVIVELIDDGGGIDPNRVRDKATAANLITADQAASRSSRELVNLVFLPGFSTVDRVTQFSGRGVGMDVVRTNIEKVGGSVEIDSRLGQGTTLRMTIPLTLAIIPALTVSCGGDRYAIPQVSLLELVYLDSENLKGIESVHSAAVYRLRGNLLPLVRLDSLLGVQPVLGEGDVNIVVLQSDDRPFGLIVDAIHDTEEIVVKPLQKQLKSVAVYSGATIMGDGSVALILDIHGVAQRAGLISGLAPRTRADQTNVVADAVDDRQSLLLSSVRGGVVAIPLSAVTRLEVFHRSEVERAGARRVVQYRGDILPLVQVSRVLRKRRRLHDGSRSRRQTAKAEAIQVIVLGDAGRQVGLVVGRILDIVHESIDVSSAATRPGVLYTAVVKNRVTEFLDVPAILRQASLETVTS